MHFYILIANKHLPVGYFKYPQIKTDNALNTVLVTFRTFKFNNSQWNSHIYIQLLGHNIIITLNKDVKTILCGILIDSSCYRNALIIMQWLYIHWGQYTGLPRSLEPATDATGCVWGGLGVWPWVGLLFVRLASTLKLFICNDCREQHPRLNWICDILCALIHGCT